MKFLIETGVMIVFLGLILGLAQACTPQAEPIAEERGVGGAWGPKIHEFKLSDGTPCVALANKYGNAISCNWGSNL